MRDKLALERTRLANERTLLAYVRTALSLLGAGAVLFQFFSGQPSYLRAAWVLVACGAGVMLIGIVRFARTSSRLKTVNPGEVTSAND